MRCGSLQRRPIAVPIFEVLSNLLRCLQAYNAPMPTNWIEAQDAEGNIYYCNNMTGAIFVERSSSCSLVATLSSFVPPHDTSTTALMVAWWVGG